VFFQSNPKQRGFNLLEVAIAGFIFATISVAFMGVWGMQVRAVEKSRHSLVATMLAEELIEQAMDDGFERTALSKPDDKPLDTIEMETEHRGPGGNWSTIPVTYYPERAVTDIGTDEDRLKKVEVTVKWEDSSGGGSIKLVTYLAGVF
jgi:Tfp pilus assembly protein PilV